jgi:hypothetical protein
MPVVFVVATRMNALQLAQTLCSCSKLPLHPRFCGSQRVTANTSACFAVRNRSTSRLALACMRQARRSNPHTERAARPTERTLPRFRALALFGRRSPERVASSSLPASENLHKSRREQLQQGSHGRLRSIYSITSSASSCNALGTSRPSALAVCKLMTSSNFVDCNTGKSAGFAPLRI